MSLNFMTSTAKQMPFPRIGLNSSNGIQLGKAFNKSMPPLHASGWLAPPRRSLQAVLLRDEAVSGQGTQKGLSRWGDHSRYSRFTACSCWTTLLIL